MGKLVIFEIGEGSFEGGFPVKVRIGEEGKPHSAEIAGRLPPATVIPENYYEWQSIYQNLPANWLITVPETQITNVSTIEACNDAAQKFQTSFNEWLNHPSVRQLERQFLPKIGDWQNVRFLLQTQDSLLRRLPWHLWDVFQSSQTQPEIIVSSEYEPAKTKLKSPVKILAVLGNSKGINIEQDLIALEEKLPGAKIEPLREPSRRELIEKLWTQSWDILFFAGHSCSHQDDSWGEIELNDGETLSLLRLRHALKHAVQKGLKLAIFNSCDGLGLARNLANLRIPYTIVMREPVPDVVAQHFLECFLTAFAAGESLYASVQQARARLHEELEDEYPCASWLPVIFQNPAAAALKYPQPQNWLKILLRIAIITVITGSLGAIFWRGVDEIRFRNRFSSGEKILVNSVATLDKKGGVQAFWWKNYNQAISKFESSLQQNPNDPETSIYLQNAKIANQATLTIGVAVPIGSNPNVAQEILRGVAQAQREINNHGGINGKFLKVQIANDDNNPDIAKQIAHRFVEEEILAVVGHNSSDASVPASDIYQAGKLMMISPTSSSTKLTDRTDRTEGNYIYRTVLSFTIIAESLAEYAKSSGITKVLICNDSKATDQSFERAFVTVMNNERLQQINDMQCDFAAKNFQPETIIKNATEKGADAILLNPQVDRLDKAIALAKVNQGKLKLLGNPSFQTKKTLEVGSAVNGMIMAVPWHAAVSPNKDFVENATKLWREPDSITWRTATAFDATQVIATALRQQKSSTEMGVQQDFWDNFSLQGATGTIKFLSWGDRMGDRVGNAVLVEVQPDPKTRTGYSFVPKNSLQNRISLGDKILFKDNPNSEKQSGVQAFAANDYNKAITSFQVSLQKMPNDPEARIYLQNAIAARSGKILKIAVSLPIGSNLNVAKEMLQGVAQAQDEVNKKGGIQGHLLQVVIASDDNDPDIAKQIASYFVVDQQILAVIGSNVSDASVAACPIYQEGKLVNISPTSFSLKSSGCGSYIFRTSPNVSFLADSLSDYAINVASTKNLAICVDEKAIDNQSFRDAFTSAIIAGGGNVINIQCDFSAPDFNPKNLIAEAISNGAEGLVLAPHVDRISKALDLAKANQGKLRLFGSTSLYTSQTLQQGQADVSNLVLAVPWHPQANFGNDFGKNAHQLWGSNVTWRSATSYDATVAIINGLQQSKTREELQKSLRSPNFSVIGTTGKIQFLQSGDRHIKNNIILVQIQPSSTSTTGYEFSFFLKPR